MTRRLSALADFAYRRRGLTVVGWIVAAVVLIGVGSSLKGENKADYNTPGSDSKAAADITKRFGGYSGQEVYVTWKDAAGANSPSVQRRLNAFFAQADKVQNISGHTLIRYSPNGQIGTTTLPLTVPGWDVTKDQGTKLIAAATANDGNGLEIKLGGDPINRAESQSSPEGVGFFGAAIVLLIAFGSVVAAGLPLAIALIGLGISSAGLIPLLANAVNVPDWTTAVSGLIGIGVGIDYSLLVLTRFRSAIHAGKDRHDAVVEAVTTAGRSVIIAGSTVVIAVLGLFLTGLSYMYGVAISAAIAVLIVMLAAISLLPALLSYLGPRVDRLRIPLLGRTLRAERTNGESPAARWSHMVQRRPWTAAIIATAILLALAAPALGMRLGFPDAGNDPPGSMTRQAYDLTAQGFGPGTNGPVVLAATLSSPSQTTTMDGLASRIRSDSDVAFVSPVRVNAAGNAALITVTPKSAPQAQATTDLVHRLRDHVIPPVTSGSGIDVKVGGVTAALEDQSTYMTNRLPLFIAGVVGLSFLLLLVAFHSPVISLKAAVMNLLSVSAAYGVMTLAANGGGLSNLIGIDHEVPVAPFMPVMMFAILFGLSMDYEVFLISRIREEYLKDGNTSRAVADGLAKTARVITAAAAIMVVVFLAFVTSDQVFLKLFGIGLASAIFLDATVVRMVLVPAVMQLLGKWNWWIPNWLERRLPRLDVERVAPAGAESS
jgi:putative drug exporter of the RND superfamily